MADSFAYSRAVSFSCILNDLQKGCWLLDIQLLLPRTADVPDFFAWDIQDSLGVFGLSFSATVQRFAGIRLLPFWTTAK